MNNNETLYIEMASIENIKTTNKGFELTCQLKNVPVSFVNGLRRILLADIPTVVIRDVEILENTTQIPHEMLRHRMEMLPVNVLPSESSIIKDAKIELRIPAEKEKSDVRVITTKNFAVESARDGILMNDRDIDAPILFVRLRKGESVHMKGRLALEHEHVSQVCTATTMWHIDPELADRARKEFVDAGNDPRIFDNSLIQRYFSRDERGRPNWFDMYIESVGVIPSKDLLKMAVQILRKKVDTYFKEAVDTIQTESDPNTYSVRLEQGGHTVGYLMQEVMYGDLNIKFVSYDIPHPLRKTMVLRFNTPKKPDVVLKAAKDTIDEYCAVVDKEL